MNAPYSVLAGFYDRLGTHPDYTAYAEFVMRLAKEEGAYCDGIILDLACGTGVLTLELAQKGADVVAIDASPEMLGEAGARLMNAGKQALLLNQDMREFELYGSVDCVVCATDSLNYLTKNEDVKKCFDLVHNYLIPDGIFVFDVNTKKKFYEVYGNESYVFEDEDVFCTWQNDFNSKSGICDFLLTFFCRQKNGTWRRYDESQREKYHSEATLKRLLAESGFELLGIYSDFAKTQASKEDLRHYYVCKNIKKEQ